jgi:hypothetical protein
MKAKRLAETRTRGIWLGKKFNSQKIWRKLAHGYLTFLSVKVILAFLFLKKKTPRKPEG